MGPAGDDVVSTRTDGPGQGDPAAHPPYLWAWRISHLTWSGTVDEETATSMAAEYGQAPVPLYQAPGAVAAAPPGDEEADADLREIIEQRRDEGYVDGSQTRTRNRLDAGWRLVPPAPPAGHEDEADVERAWSGIEPEDRGTLRSTWPLLGRALDALAAARGPR